MFKSIKSIKSLLPKKLNLRSKQPPTNNLLQNPKAKSYKNISHKPQLNIQNIYSMNIHLKKTIKNQEIKIKNQEIKIKNQTKKIKNQKKKIKNQEKKIKKIKQKLIDEIVLNVFDGKNIKPYLTQKQTPNFGNKNSLNIKKQNSSTKSSKKSSKKSIKKSSKKTKVFGLEFTKSERENLLKKLEN